MEKNSPRECPTCDSLKGRIEILEGLLIRSKSVLMAYHRRLGPNGPLPCPLEADIDSAMEGVYKCFGHVTTQHSTKRAHSGADSERERFRRYLRENAEEVRKWPEWMRLEAGRSNA
jgi:hypothetical protein